jgi:membrane-associated phospholipid phosphatase
MTKILIVLIWPVALGLIVCAAVLLSRREANTGLVTHPKWTTAWHSALERVKLATRRLPAWAMSLLVLAVILVAGAIVVYGVLALLGLLVVHKGPVIDKPIYHWTTAHRVHPWTSVMTRLTKIGDTWTTWGAAATAAVCLAVARPKRKWLPAVALIAVIVVDHFDTLAIRGTFARPGPPNSPGGTFPSGGCDRVILFYGTIAYFLWRDFSGKRTAAIWASAAVAALAINEAYSRLYLTLHWFTDVLSGLLYGFLLLGVFVTAIRLVERSFTVSDSPTERQEAGVRSREQLGGRPDYVPG